MKVYIIVIFTETLREIGGVFSDLEEAKKNRAKIRGNLSNLGVYIVQREIDEMIKNQEDKTEINSL